MRRIIWLKIIHYDGWNKKYELEILEKKPRPFAKTYRGSPSITIDISSMWCPSTDHEAKFYGLHRHKIGRIHWTDD